MKKKSGTTAAQLLEKLRTKHVQLHKAYEELFWKSYMGDHSVDDRMSKALEKRDAFAADPKNMAAAEKALVTAKKNERDALLSWKKYFSLYQTPESVVSLRKKINDLETKIHKRMATAKEGYTDPKTKKFVKCSRLKMRTIIRTSDDEKLRKACFGALEQLGTLHVDDYVKRVGLLNEYARQLGYEDFYAYKIELEEGMTKSELFAIFDEIFEKTKYAHDDIRKLEKEKPGLRKPWNFGYMMAGDFTKEDDQYFPFDQALERWGRSFAALGVDFKKGRLQLDLLDREGKYSNGFCHWPDLIRFEGAKRIPGSSNFTCNVVYGQVGSAAQGYHTLFHEGGHAAHYLNSEQRETCLNHEYPPASTAWAETQSMFMDTIFSSYEWRSRYAVNNEGVTYPFDLFERKARTLHALRPLDLSGILFVTNFEKQIYEAKDLTKEKVIDIAKKAFRKHFDRSEDSVYALQVPHIYSWSSTCSYHGYGLAQLAVEQWREYFYKKYGYVVDNPNIAKEMKKVWSLGSVHSFKEFVIMATGKKLSAKAWLSDSTASLQTVLKSAKKKAQTLAGKPHYTKRVNLNSTIAMVSGKKKIADNAKSFEDMAKKYAAWLEGQR